MNKETFKLRMLSLKSYREQNPGKTYIDWKINSYEEGGEVNPKQNKQSTSSSINELLSINRDSNFYNRQLPKLGPTLNTVGKPIARGNASPVFDLEDFVNFTPIGDAITAKDIGESVYHKDWIGAGLAALTAIPFVPVTVKEFRKSFRGITPKSSVGNASRSIGRVDKDAFQRSLDASMIEAQRKAELIANRSNDKYKIVERLTDDPSYMQRALEVKDKFKDDYMTTYADIINAYNDAPNQLPKVTILNNRNNKTVGRLTATEDAINRHKSGGDFPRIDEYEYQIDPNYNRSTDYVTEHELNHYVDALKNKSFGYQNSNSNMFAKMSDDMKGIDIDGMNDYFSRPGELKAYINLLREYLFNSGKMESRGLKLTTKQLLDAMKIVPEYGPIGTTLRAAKLFKDMKTYTKWFNAVPLLTLPPLMMYNNQAKQNNNQ